MTLSSLFAPAYLIIWLPGLLFLSAVACCLYRHRQGATCALARRLALASLILSLIPLYLIPQLEMNRAIRFANSLPEAADQQIDRYADISYAGLAAWFDTARPDSAEAADAAVGSDLFDFSAPTAGPAAADPASRQSSAPATTATLVYAPQTSVAWLMLMLWLLLGGILLAQKPDLLRR